MDRADYPGFEPADDDIDDLLGSAAGLVANLYAGQKAELAAILTRLRETARSDALDSAAPCRAADRAAAAVLLHRIAGTGLYFDDRVLGTLAASAEHAILDAPAAQLFTLCAQLLPLCESR